jgi:hypothetical protein
MAMQRGNGSAPLIEARVRVERRSQEQAITFVGVVCRLHGRQASSARVRVTVEDTGTKQVLATLSKEGGAGVEFQLPCKLGRRCADHLRVSCHVELGSAESMTWEAHARMEHTAGCSEHAFYDLKMSRE